MRSVNRKLAVFVAVCINRIAVSAAMPIRSPGIRIEFSRWCLGISPKFALRATGTRLLPSIGIRGNILDNDTCGFTH